MNFRTIAALFAAIALPRSAVAVVVLIFSSGDSSLDTATRNVFAGAGHTVSVGPQYFDFTGSELTGVQAVVFLANANWNGDMAAGGQSALVNFVNSGGGLVTGEWVNWKIGIGQLTTLAPIMPVALSSDYSSGNAITYTQAAFDATLSAGLPSSFTFPADDFGGVESYFAPKTGATAYYSSSGGTGGAGVVGWTLGGGRVLQISTTIGPGQLADSNYTRLLQNSVAFVTVPEPGTLTLLGLGGTLLLALGRRRASQKRA